MLRYLSAAIPLALVVSVVLTACGGSTPTPPSQADAMATINAGLKELPTALAEPTLTAEERKGIQTISERTKSMTKAATDLQALGEEIRATVAWKTKVRTAAQVITGGQKTIAGVQLPAFYAPLAQRVTMITENCAKPAEALIAADVDKLDIATVKAQDEALQRWCLTEMERLQLSFETLK